jgi:ABC-type multidrug transport system fused ATPase/permease subunit
MIISKAISASAAFFDIIDSERISTTGLREPVVSSHTDIVFQNVVFAYPTRPNIYVLNGFNARFERGKTTAIVGPSGTGKSTVIALIERWYHLQAPSDSAEENPSGDIFVDGQCINNVDLKWLRSQIGLVEQEPFLFNDSVYNNICFGLIGSKWENESEDKKMELIIEACKEAFADEFIERLPLVTLFFISLFCCRTPPYIFYALPHSIKSTTTDCIINRAILLSLAKVGLH